MSFRSHRAHSVKSKEEIIAEIESTHKFNVLNTLVISDRVSTVFLEIKLMRFYTSSMIISVTFSEVTPYKTEIFVEIFNHSRVDDDSDFSAMNKAWQEINLFF